MTQKEKLIELINSADKLHGSVYAGVKYPLTTAQLADCLLANGVVVLPCKVGDTVYRLFDDDYEQFVVTGITIHMSGNTLISAECDIHGHGFYNYRKCKEDFCGRNAACYTQFYDFDIGKTVFLTREEAEAALKKMEGEK